MQAYNRHKILDIRHLTPYTYVLRMERKGLPFVAGQHVLLGKEGSIHRREYSIYSAEKDNFFEVLIREVENGQVSRELKVLEPGAFVYLEGPLGFFTLEVDAIPEKPHLFVATGTGIAPFRAFARSYPQLDYQLIHGVRYSSEAYDRNDYPPERYHLCTSRDTLGQTKGRVTGLLRKMEINAESHCYLCGNFKMIHEAFEILESKGIPPQQLHAEVYF